MKVRRARRNGSFANRKFQFVPRHDQFAPSDVCFTNARTEFEIAHSVSVCETVSRSVRAVDNARFRNDSAYAVDDAAACDDARETIFITAACVFAAIG